MRSFRRILPFIILNVIISAATTLAVLYWWDKTQRPVLPDPRIFSNITTPQVGSTIPPSQAGSPTIQVTLTAQNLPVIQIQNVFGVGDIENEVVQLKRAGSGDLWLTGWQLKDQNGHTFTFPKLLLNKDGAVQIYTHSGPDTVIELHWGLKSAVWRTGELVSLLDPQGILRASYQIP